MGRKNDTIAVINNHTNMYGVQGLKVVDASSFSIPNRLCTEKIADGILSFVE